ncbi:PAS domain-containing protein [Salibaculum sp.]|uniref:PAS domain-containing protein n=1 Tax=Salibaculum sp. TaxID=2855480 RepID=UPI002B49C7FA|nr:PAS domain-containing protein [Salibaculum sp.]HKL70557.1 PAS domain-containing protein [Salibaculum sp.]
MARFWNTDGHNARNRSGADFMVTNPTALVELESYWRGLAPAGRVPRRSALDPALIGDVIEDALILERVAPGVARIRVAGQRIAVLAGSEPRGMPLSVLFTPGDRGRLATQVEVAFRMPSVVELPLRAARAPGRPALSGRLLLLPLCDDAGSVSRCLCALVADGNPGGGPRRFSILDDPSIRHEPLDRAPLDPPRRRPAAGGPALRLVVDNA